MKKIILSLSLFLVACTTPTEQTPTTTPQTMPTPGGYIQFCQDFPQSVLCE